MKYLTVLLENGSGGTGSTGAGGAAGIDAGVKKIFGTINPPQGLESFANNPVGAASNLLTVGIRLFFIFAGVTALFYMLRGSFDWITSAGDKEKISAARERIVNALVGILILVAVLALIATLEQFVFDTKFCFGLTCPIELPQVNR